MVVRRQKKVRGQRRSRTYGWGNPKKHRGSGSRGGRGNAGRGKRGQQNVTELQGNSTLGRDYKCRIPCLIFHEKALNVGDIERDFDSLMGRLGLKEKSGSKAAELDLSKLGYTKVLGAGKISRKVVVKADRFSSRAAEKIKAAGGEAIPLVQKPEKKAGKTEGAGASGAAAEAENSE